MKRLERRFFLLDALGRVFRGGCLGLDDGDEDGGAQDTYNDT